MKKPRAKTAKGRKRRTGNAAGSDLRTQAQRLLATVYGIRQSLADIADFKESRRLRALLKQSVRMLRTYRMELEKFRGSPFGGPELEEQIQLFLLLEDECRTDRPVRSQ